jgi:hypothetical protein
MRDARSSACSLRTGGTGRSRALVAAESTGGHEEKLPVRFQIGTVLFFLLLAVAVANSGSDGDERYGLFAVVAAITLLFAGFDLKRLPRWQRVAVRLAYCCVGAVLLFLVWVVVIGH